jgi:hypothetical protein
MKSELAIKWLEIIIGILCLIVGGIAALKERVLKLVEI